jgi:hypothetical protein
MWFEILKKPAKVKIHLPTLRIKVAEWAEMNREGRHAPQDIIDYVKDDVIAASVDNWAKKHNNPNWAYSNVDRMKSVMEQTLDSKGILGWMPRIGPTLKALGFRQVSRDMLEEEEGKSPTMWQDEKDFQERRRRLDYEESKRGAKNLTQRYGGSAKNWEYFQQQRR